MRHVGFTEWDRRSLSPAPDFDERRVRNIDLRGTRYSNPFWLVPEKQLIYPCIEGVSKSRLHGVRPIGRCGRWECETCGEMLKRRLIGEIEHLRQQHDGYAVFTVLTWYNDGKSALGKSGKPIGVETQLKQAARWRKAVKQVLGTDAYGQFPEWHKNGVMHLNLSWFGVSRGFTSCNVINSRGSVDMRLECRYCTACRLRDAWRVISGATRSTHTKMDGGIAPYVTKYLTKDSIGQRYKPTGLTMKRYSFSRTCKRTPSVVPVYRWLGQTMRDEGLWRFGKKESQLDERLRDYITDEDLFHGDRSTYGIAGYEDYDGVWLPRSVCSEKHHGLCDRVPYWSPTKQKAWGYKHWDWFKRQFGDDTEIMLKQKIWRAWQYVEPQVDSWDKAWQS